MTSIDFLPDEYREKYAVRYQRLWRLIVLLVFGGAVGTATAVQVWVSRDIDRRLAQNEVTYRAAQEQSKQIDALYQQIDGSKDRAALVLLLDRQWPLSRLLAGCFLPVDDGIAIESWRLKRHGLARTAPAQRRTLRNSNSTTKKPSVRPEREDLIELNEKLQQTDSVIDIQGAARDLPSLYRYVGRLSTCPLFSHVELNKLESDDSDGTSAVVHFAVEVRVRSTLLPPPDKTRFAQATAQMAGPLAALGQGKD